MAGIPWTEQELRQLTWHSGYSGWREVAEALGRSHKAVRDKARRAGVVWTQGVTTASDVAKELGCHRTTVVRYAKQIFDGRGLHHTGDAGPGRRYLLTDEQVDELKKHLRRALRLQRGPGKKA